MKELIHEIRELIQAARQAVVYSVDQIQVLTNFEIGRRIVKHEQHGKERAEYGDAVLKDLSIALTDEFGRGFSQTNLKMMRRFYLTYQNQISQTLSGLLPVPGKGQTLSDLLQKPEAVPQGLPGNTRTTSVHFNLSWSHYVFLMTIEKDAERRFYEIESASQCWSLRELKRQFSS